MELRELTAFLDKYLRAGEIRDFPPAFNGLHLENHGKVTRIAAAVDAAEAVIVKAINAGADFLLVHHGLFWKPLAPIGGPSYRKLKQAMDAGLAIYSSHLPLDAHPEVGNNIEICRALALAETEPFFEEFGTLLGQRARVEIPRAELVERLSLVVGGPVHCCPGGPEVVRELGIVSGGCGSEIARIADLGIDTFITGEGPHWSYTLAEELGLNVLYAGHYATETFGVKALASLIESRFGIPWIFVDHPTGL